MRSGSSADSKVGQPPQEFRSGPVMRSKDKKCKFVGLYALVKSRREALQSKARLQDYYKTRHSVPDRSAWAFRCSQDNGKVIQVLAIQKPKETNRDWNRLLQDVGVVR